MPQLISVLVVTLLHFSHVAPSGFRAAPSVVPQGFEGPADSRLATIGTKSELWQFSRAVGNVNLGLFSVPKGKRLVITSENFSLRATYIDKGTNGGYSNGGGSDAEYIALQAFDASNKLLTECDFSTAQFNSRSIPNSFNSTTTFLSETAVANTMIYVDAGSSVTFHPVGWPGGVSPDYFSANVFLSGYLVAYP